MDGWIKLSDLFSRYVHRSRRFDNAEQQQQNNYDPYESSTSPLNPFDVPSQPYRSTTLTPPSPVNGSKPFHLRRHTRSADQKRKVTIVLIFCLFVALLLWTPQSLSLTYETLIESYEEMSQDHRIRLLIFNNFANLFLCINASIDFILYCFLSEKFARTCRQIFCRQCTIPEANPAQRTRMISLERASFIFGHSPSNMYHQQLANNNTHKYYIRLYDFYRNSSGLKSRDDKKWKKKLARSSPTTIKCDNHIFYHRSLSKNQSNYHYPKPSNGTLNAPMNSVSDSLDRTKLNHESDGSNLHRSRTLLVT